MLMKRISLHFSALLATLFLFAFSCQDHYVPEEPEPEALKIKTLEIESPTNGEYSLSKFGVVIEKLGNKSINEFGLVISIHWIGNNDYKQAPTINDQTLSIDKAPTLGEYTFIESSFERDEVVEVYYRAYAELADGQVVYGEILKFTPPSTVSVRLTDVSGKNAPITADIDISDLGGIDVEEYGVVYSYKTNANDPITSRPTLNDNKVKSVIPIKLGKQTIALPIPGNSVSDMNVRPYVKYKNGNVYYGNIVG